MRPRDAPDQRSAFRNHRCDLADESGYCQSPAWEHVHFLVFLRSYLSTRRVPRLASSSLGRQERRREPWYRAEWETAAPEPSCRAFRETEIRQLKLPRWGSLALICVVKELHMNLHQVPALGILTLGVLLPGPVIAGSVRHSAGKPCGTMQLSPSNVPQTRTCTLWGGPLGGYTTIMRLSAVIAFEPSPSISLRQIHRLESEDILEPLCARARIVSAKGSKLSHSMGYPRFERLVRTDGIETVRSHFGYTRAKMPLLRSPFLARELAGHRSLPGWSTPPRQPESPARESTGPRLRRDN